MKRVVLVLLLLLVPFAASAASGPAERIAALAAAPDLPGALTPDTVEKRLAPLVRLIRRATTPVTLFTDAGAGSSVWVRSANARFLPDGRARLQFEFTPSPELTFDALAAAIEIQRGAPSDRGVLRRSWESKNGIVRLYTGHARDNGDDVIVLELLKESGA
jgi:hypothetical protein